MGTSGSLRLGDIAYRRARYAIIVEGIEQMGDRDEIPFREPTHEEIADAAEVDVAHILLERNAGE